MADEDCVPCAKVVIDSGLTAGGMVACLGPTVALYAALGIYPTEKEARKIQKAAEDYAAAGRGALDRMAATLAARRP